MLKWFTANYEFDYFLRIDDDYFLCMNRLLLELPHRPKHGMYWGYVHCRPNTARVDEGWMILSRDIITEALSKYNTTLLCHPFGDQAVALWIKESKLNITWFSDRRVVHSATAYANKRYRKENLCNRYLALHGTYQMEMLLYWIFSKSEVVPLHRVSNNLKNTNYEIPRIPRIQDVCKTNLSFTTSAFYPHVRFEPKLCRDNPKWRITNDDFVGRQQAGQEANY